MVIQHLIAPALTLALALGAASPIQAQDANAGAGAPPPWATESARPDHTKDIPTDEALLRQHLAGGDAAPSGTVNPAQKMRPPSAVASGQGASQSGRDENGNSVAAAVKDFVKPLHQEISNSSVVQVVREIDATVGGRGQADGAEGRPGYIQAGADATSTAQGNRKSDPNAAALMWQQFIDEVVPWAIGAAALAGVGYGIFFWLKMIKLKRLKQGDKRRGARRDRRAISGTSSRVTLVDTAPHEAAVPDFRLDARAAPTGSRRSSGSSSRRSFNRSSGGSPGRSSSRSPSRSSGRASGEPTP